MSVGLAYSILTLILKAEQGFSITTEEIDLIVESYITSNNVTGWTSLGPVVSALKGTPKLRWANPLDVKNATDKAFVARFGAKESNKSKGKVSPPIVIHNNFVTYVSRFPNLQPRKPWQKKKGRLQNLLEK